MNGVGAVPSHCQHQIIHHWCWCNNGEEVYQLCYASGDGFGGGSKGFVEVVVVSVVVGL